ncbi:hypothetical protein C8R44DRAFT_826356 [Mycena epipterygia]|nr:hypothetical protein C8R44DRAFT_826356 [Mycena epipterygia]
MAYGSPRGYPITAGCSSQATVHVVRRLKGGKPVIYLFAPNVKDAAVRLTLTRDWDLSAVYPVVQQTKSIPGGDTVEWQVRVHPDGTLTHHRARFEPCVAQSESFSPRPAISPPRTPSFSPSTPSRPTLTRRSANSTSIQRRARRS